MRIRMTKTIAGPDGTVCAGKPADFPEKKAVRLVTNGYAEYVKETTVETAIAEPVKETAAIRTGKPKQKAKPKKKD